ncbi:MAG TPA: formate--tetrahydrofolate ligase [Clostridiales bacterium]|nr:formate--tetrahydrofolate ligase [Clostridiales bacterium]HQP69646.1 formate--tetrahydrofolate ligase [Clostridiales bacterium]
MPNDVEIARSAKIEHISDIAKKLGIDESDLEYYGKYKAKLPLKLIDLEKVQKSKLILVSAITPTPAGEGKTTISIGLSQALNLIGKKTTVVLREPSLGPVFGVKGGAAGGGYAQVLPMEDINLHFTGDISAVEKANNLLAALIDNELQIKNSKLNLDARTISWRRVMDMNDRSLRDIVIGLGGQKNSIPRETGFDITAASEVMAILCLSNDLSDLKKKLGNIFIGYSHDKKPVFVRDMKAEGAMAALLKDAINPNLVQMIGGCPAIIHGGPFANIAQGTNSIIATRMGLTLSDYVVTEAGFGFDLGAEKFFDIKCRTAGLNPSAVVLVATVRALKFHGGAKLKELKTENIEALKKGLENIEKHIENMKVFGICPVVAINRFYSDTDEEVKIIKEFVESKNVTVAVADVWEKGGEGGIDLAKKVSFMAETCNRKFIPLYEWEWPIEKKIEKIAKTIYGAEAIDYTAQAKNDIKRIIKLGLDKLPVCIAKTQKSLSDDPELLGRPKDFVVTVREIKISSGAGFLVPITGEIMRMPGLPDEPSAYNIDIDNDGNIEGLF